MEFFKNIQKSIYSPKFYQELLTKPFSYSLKYFLPFSLLMALVATTYLSVSALPEINTFLKGAGSAVLGYFPDELEVVIKDGMASTNVPEPYFLKIPAELSKDLGADMDVRDYGIENFLVIDTQLDEVTLEDFQDYKTILLLSKKTIMSYDDEQVVIQPLTDIPNFKIDKRVISSLLSKITPYFRFANPLFIISVFVGYFSFIFSAKMFYLSFAALLIWIVTKIIKVDVGYKKAYQLGLHLLTASILYEIIFGLILKISGIPFLFTGLILVLAVVNLKPTEISPETPLKKENAPQL